MFFRKKRKEIGQEFVKKAGLEKLKEQQVIIEELKKKMSSIQEGEAFEDSLHWLANLWLHIEECGDLEEDLYIDDPIHGGVRIENDILPIYLCPLVQRLNFIRQLSFSYLSYPSALHSRLSHSLGVSSLMERIILRILTRNRFFPARKNRIKSVDEEKVKWYVKVAKIAGLLHDLGHSPFGHALDNYIGYMKGVYPYPDKVFSVEYFDKYLQGLSNSCKIPSHSIRQVLQHGNEDFDDEYLRLINQVLDSDLDIDRIDYLVRDAYHTGLRQGMVNLDPLVSEVAPFWDKDGKLILTYHSNAIPHIRHFFYAHDVMYVDCYENSSKLAAERMLVKAVHDITSHYGESTLDSIRLLTDAQLEDLIITNTDATMPCFKLITELKRGRIFEEIYSLNLAEAKKKGQLNSEIEHWVEGLGQSLAGRRGNGVQDEAKIYHVDEVFQFEKYLSEKAGLGKENSWMVAVTVPTTFTLRFQGVQILPRNESEGNPESLADRCSTIKKILTLLLEERQKMRVFVSKSTSPGKKSRLHDMAKAKFEK